MSGQSSAQKTASKTAGLAPKTLEQSRSNFLASPEYAGQQDIVQQILANPYTFSQQDIDRIYQGGAATAYQSANGFVDQQNAKQGAQGVFRSGGTNALHAQAGAQLGEQLAGAQRQGQLMAAQQRIPDLANAYNLAGQLSQTRSAYDSNIANAQLGQANVLGGLAGQPTPLQSGLGGLGSILGSTVGAAGQAGGFGKLMK